MFVAFLPCSLYHWVIPWPGDINGADTMLSECVCRVGGRRAGGIRWSVSVFFYLNQGDTGEAILF